MTGEHAAVMAHLEGARASEGELDDSHSAQQARRDADRAAGPAGAAMGGRECRVFGKTATER